MLNGMSELKTKGTVNLHYVIGLYFVCIEGSFLNNVNISGQLLLAVF